MVPAAGSASWRVRVAAEIRRAHHGVTTGLRAQAGVRRRAGPKPSTQAGAQLLPRAERLSPVPRVVIVGGGMGGTAAARELARAPVDVLLVDMHNYYLFQPLIYEVAGAIVNIEDVTHALRSLLRGQANARVRLGTVVAADFDRREVVLEDDERIAYDYLILAAGLRSDVTRIPGAAEHAFAMKTLDDALRVRNHLLRRLEATSAHPELLDTGTLDVVVVGGSTTGVEVVGALSEIYNHALRQEFPEIDFNRTKITLVEAGEALLPMFHPTLRGYVERVLVENGAEVRLQSPVAEIGPAYVRLESGEEIAAGTIIAATGVHATPLADRLELARMPNGRVIVSRNLTIAGYGNVFAIGDMAALPKHGGELHPALAQFALQGGRHAAREIVRQLEGKASRPFRYWDKGMTSTVGYNAAVLQSGRIRLTGGLAFLLWGALHAYYVPGLRNRLSLRLTWIWSWATRRRAALLLLEELPARSRFARTRSSSSA